MVGHVCQTYKMTSTGKRLYLLKRLKNRILSMRSKTKRLCLFVIISTLFILTMLPTYMRLRLHHCIFGQTSTACQIPTPDMGENTMQYIMRTVTKPLCKSGFPPMVAQTQDTIYRLQYPFLNTSYLDCCYVPFRRKYPRFKDFEYIEDYVVEDTCTLFGQSAGVRAEFLKVHCSYKHTPMYEDYFSFVPDKYRIAFDPPRGAFNVLLVGIKGVSRLNLYRNMPKTLRYLRNRLNATEYFKFNKIGGSSFSNLSPLLTGMNSDDFKDRCMSKDGEESDPICPFIWDVYSLRGFRTAFGEDCSKDSMFRGHYVFTAKPTDYYWSTFNVAADENMGNIRKGRCYVCLGSRMAHELLLDYVRNFATTMKGYENKYFGMFWINSLTSSGEAKDGLNLLSIADDYFAKFLGDILRDGLLKNTVMVFFSESGYMNRELMGVGEFLTEEKLPFLFFVTPERFTWYHPELHRNIRLNSPKLVTAFDLHKTLEDLVDVSNFEPEDLRQSYKFKAYSLLHKLPAIRLCKWAGIENKYCSCKDKVTDIFTKFI